MKTPAFWAKHGAVAQMLEPFGAITAVLTARRVAKPGFDPGIPVICAGNAGVGGAGKTILARDVLERLPGRPFALTRGHGGSNAGPIRVQPHDRAAEMGDEALLLAASGPTIVARDRAAGARLAVAQGATAIVMDDGLQNPGLRKTISLLVIDGGYGFGNSLLLPAGPLREPVAAAAARCRAAVLIGPDIFGAAGALPTNLPLLRANLVAGCETDLAGEAVVAFAGIGRPEKFFGSVAGLGAHVAAAKSFADHHRYTAADVAYLRALAVRHGALLVTTEKDAVKLPAELGVAVVTVSLAWADPGALMALIL